MATATLTVPESSVGRGGSSRAPGGEWGGGGGERKGTW